MSVCLCVGPVLVCHVSVVVRGTSTGMSCKCGCVWDQYWCVSLVLFYVSVSVHGTSTGVSVWVLFYASVSVRGTSTGVSRSR